MTYLTPDVMADDSAVAEGILAAIADRIPGWAPADGSFEAALAEALGIAIATANQVLINTSGTAFAGFASAILSILRETAAPATCSSTWTIADDNGILIPGGTQVTLTLPSGDDAGFTVAQDVTVPSGTTVQLGVQLIAVDGGTVNNGATNPASQVELSRIDTISIDAPASAGVDDETDASYTARAADRARRLHAIPITPADFATFATDVDGVTRCAAINLLDPSFPDDVSTGHITLYPVDENGAPVSDEVKSAIAAYFATVESPLNVTLHIADVTIVDITIVAAVEAVADADKGAVEDACTAALEAAFDPPSFDADPDSDGGWANPRSTEITIYDVAAVLDQITGVRKITDIEINGGTSVEFTDPVSLPMIIGDPPSVTSDPTVTVS